MTPPTATIVAENLTRRFGEFTAVQSLSFQVARGAIVGFLGPSGSGKTTTIRMLCGLLRPSEGEIRVNDVDVVRHPRAVRHCLGYMAQRYALYPDLTVTENLEFYGGVYGLSGRELRSRLDDTLERMALTGLRVELVSTLPLGWKQRVALAAAILHRPPVLILDEPTSGVDAESARLFWQVLYELAETGTSVLLSTHTMDEAERCHQVGVMYQARLVALGTPRVLREGFQGRLFCVTGSDPEQVRLVARHIPEIDEATVFGARVHLATRLPTAEALQRVLEHHRLPIETCYSIAPTMEDVFVQLTRRYDERWSISPWMTG